MKFGRSIHNTLGKSLHFSFHIGLLVITLSCIPKITPACSKADARFYNLKEEPRKRTKEMDRKHKRHTIR